MHALVTGAAGFIGSHLAEALLGDGHRVTAVDGFTDYYDVEVKARNVAAVAAHPAAELVEADLLDLDLPALLEPVDVVFHQAGQPGVRLSWGESFAVYERCNVLATQRLLEAAMGADLDRFVYASSSSVYGDAPRFPTTEEDLPRPMSPYGVTKLAGEHLCGLYARQWSVPTVALRYFTVYGPRQRPDMAFHRLTRAALTGEPFPLYGTGDQIRDFTFVDDVVRANLRAATADLEPGVVMNIAGGGAARLRDLIDLAGELAGRPVNIERHPAAPGDATRTGGAIDRASALLGWEPSTDVQTGLKAELEWMRDLLG